MTAVRIESTQVATRNVRNDLSFFGSQRCEIKTALGVQKRVEKIGTTVLWHFEASTHCKCLQTTCSAATWFSNAALFEKQVELFAQQVDVFASEHFGHESAARFENVSGDIQSSQN